MYSSPLPMPIPSTPHSQNIAETVQQVGEFVEDPEDEKEEMMLVTTVALGPHSEGCLLAGVRREICTCSQNGPLPQVVSSLQIGSKKKRIIHDKPALVPKERIVPSQMVLVENVMMMEIDL